MGYKRYKTKTPSSACYDAPWITGASPWVTTKNAENLMAALCLAALICYWI